MITTKSKISELTEFYIVFYAVINVIVSIIGIKGANSHKREMLIPFVAYGAMHLIGLTMIVLCSILSPVMAVTIVSHLKEILKVHGFDEETVRNIRINEPILMLGILLVFILIVYLTLVVFSYYQQMGQPAELFYSGLLEQFNEVGVDADRDSIDSSALS